MDERAGLVVSSLTQRLQSGATQWFRALDGTGVVVFHTDQYVGSSQATLLTHSAGVVLGRVFSRDIANPESAAHVIFDGKESSLIVASGGRRLLENYWGRYVAILRNGSTGEVWLLRDPSGAFPCWLARHEGISIICSDIEDCDNLGAISFTVNWSYIAAFVAHSALQIRETALNEVTEVQPGERLRFSSGSMERSIEWNPIDIARASPLEDPEEAVASIRAATIGCVHTWAACYGGILHNLSGGLDSSIVLSCLMTAPSAPEVTCLNYFAKGPNEDERQYARAMAKHTGVKLVEHELDARAVRLKKLLSLRRSARPWFYMYEIEHSRFESELAGRHDAAALFSGAGGDGVFYQSRAELAVTDYLFNHGLGGGLLRTAIDAARVSRQSIWPLLWQALHARVFGISWDPIAITKPVERTIVNRDVIAAVKRDKTFAHPWLAPEATRGVPPGILWHAMSVSLPPAFYSSFVRGPCPERTMPLLSQPLVETCLRIPTYTLIRGGRDRALARRAFAGDLPGEIVRRHAKGRADQHVRNILDANLEFVRELLLDGLLVKQGLLNRATLSQYLNRSRSPADFQYSEILQEHICAEAWLRAWLTTPCAVAG
jgi:asparagine synthase (glutamine-hydrolysing)